MTVETIIATILRRMGKMSKSKKKFFSQQLNLILMLPLRCNYLSFERYGCYDEKTYRYHYNKNEFDFAKFNFKLIEEELSKNRIIAFDPCHIRKSGQHTPGVGYFWSGSSNSIKWGLEICGIGVVDLESNCALHYEAVQTIPKDGQGLLDFYQKTIIERADNLKKMSKYAVFDAYFAKKGFVSSISAAGLHVVTRLRNDAAIYEFPTEPTDKTRGRKRIKGAKIDTKNLDHTNLTCQSRNQKEAVFIGKIYVQSLGIYVMANIVQRFDQNGKFKVAHIYICTDTKVEEDQVYIMYKARFQIEFLYRDSKQFSGLEESQSRNEQALNYHFNASLTAVSVAKAAYHLSVPKEKRGPFSMASIKSENHNDFMINRIFELFAENPNITKNDKKIQILRSLGKIAC